MTRLEIILKQAKDNRRLSSELRTLYIEELTKLAQEGVLQTYQGGVHSYKTREQNLSERGGDKSDSETLYGVNPCPTKKTDISVREHSDSLSTRYVPDKPGVQSQRVKGTNGGVTMDPYTNKIYDWNEGFKTEDGREFQPSSVRGQTEIFSYSSICHPDKLKKFSQMEDTRLPFADIPFLTPLAKVTERGVPGSGYSAKILFYANPERVEEDRPGFEARYSESTGDIIFRMLGGYNESEKTDYSPVSVGNAEGFKSYLEEKFSVLNYNII